MPDNLLMETDETRNFINSVVPLTKDAFPIEETNIESFIRVFDSIVTKAAKCERVDSNKVVEAIKNITKIPSEIWNAAEPAGAWSSRVTEAHDRSKLILTEGRVLNVFIDALLYGCECRKVREYMVK